MWVMIWCIVSQGAPPPLTGNIPPWNFINFQIYWTIDPGLDSRVFVSQTPSPTINWPSKQRERNSQHTNHNRTWWFSSLKDNLVSEKECMIGILFRNCQRTGIIVKHANGLMVRPMNEERNNQLMSRSVWAEVLAPMQWLRPCVGVNCYECRGLGQIVRGGGRGADGDGDKVDNGDTRDLELT